MFQLIVDTSIQLIVFAAYLVIASFLVWMLVDAAKQDRFWWVVIILGVPLIGAAAYYITEKKHEYAIAPNHHIHKSETEAQHEQAPKHHVHEEKASNETANVAEGASTVKESQESEEVTIDIPVVEVDGKSKEHHPHVKHSGAHDKNS
jgi:hypothetical protein